MGCGLVRQLLRPVEQWPHLHLRQLGSGLAANDLATQYMVLGRLFRGWDQISGGLPLLWRWLHRRRLNVHLDQLGGDLDADRLERRLVVCRLVGGWSKPGSGDLRER